MLEIVSSEPNSRMKDTAKAMRFMMTMTITCIIAVFVGNFFDEMFQTSPIILLIFLAYAIVSSLYMLVKGFGEPHE